MCQLHHLKLWPWADDGTSTKNTRPLFRNHSISYQNNSLLYYTYLLQRPVWINRPQTGGLRLSASITISWPGFSKLVECLWKGNYYKVTSWLLRAITHLHFHRALKEGIGRGACPGRGRTEAWPWTRDHTGPWALKQNKWTQTPGQLENRAGPPPQRSPQTFILLLRSWFHICRNSQAPDGKELPGHRNSPPTGRTKASFCFVYMRWVSPQWRRCGDRSDSIQLGL